MNPVFESILAAQTKVFLVAPALSVTISRFESEDPNEADRFQIRIALDQVNGLEYAVEIAYPEEAQRDQIFDQFGQAEAERFYLNALDWLTLMLNGQPWQ